ncbi:hypothetical protein B0H17DRAFT_1144476 [Mycena rosella]|uniref:Uncharacterized protein n=1 Tax=Mycena rosella TaxID=1033263 RepID=A0AAD7G6M5_MYCRO|nr:hypothetical protein B0H17DRAFT_1144476 [Mycena rosella]
MCPVRLNVRNTALVATPATAFRGPGRRGSVQTRRHRSTDPDAQTMEGRTEGRGRTGDPPYPHTSGLARRGRATGSSAPTTSAIAGRGRATSLPYHPELRNRAPRGEPTSQPLAPEPSLQKNIQDEEMYAWTLEIVGRLPSATSAKRLSTLGAAPQTELPVVDSAQRQDVMDIGLFRVIYPP